MEVRHTPACRRWLSFKENASVCPRCAFMARTADERFALGVRLLSREVRASASSVSRRA